MAGPDLSVLMAVVDFDTVVDAVLGVATVILAVVVTQKGAQMVLSAIRGDSGGLTREELEREWQEYNEMSRLSDESRKKWGD